MEPTQERASLVRSEEVWFDDGNIILVAENKAFRVHRSMLVRHSQVFKDLFELSQPRKMNQANGRSRSNACDMYTVTKRNAPVRVTGRVYIGHAAIVTASAIETAVALDSLPMWKIRRRYELNIRTNRRRGGGGLFQ